ncbi:MAG TPA: GxxExxY protein [Candidatus Sulfotelmatobacter sp.]|nr:GxxExxY protein [Candidatus Sulfotelmatobacter sp.]
MDRPDAATAESHRGEPDGRVDEVARAVIGAAIEVHRCLGPGYLERVYEGALRVELRLRGIAFERQKAIPVVYKGQAIGQGRVDFLIEDDLILELKAVDTLLPIHTAQMISYLKALRRRLGLLINFNVPMLRRGIQRIVRS